MFPSFTLERQVLAQDRCQNPRLLVVLVGPDRRPEVYGLQYLLIDGPFEMWSICNTEILKRRENQNEVERASSAIHHALMNNDLMSVGSLEKQVLERDWRRADRSAAAWTIRNCLRLEHECR